MPWLAIHITALQHNRAAVEAIAPLLLLLKRVLDHIERNLSAASASAQVWGRAGRTAGRYLGVCFAYVAERNV
jgi:hypothetical protein